jgi:rhodanese-related sulfurtransferase
MMLPQLLTRFRSPVREITAHELEDALRTETPPVLIDIRSAEQFAAGRLPGAVRIPLNCRGAEAAGLDPSAPTVVY